jgi:hypothetical protein
MIHFRCDLCGKDLPAKGDTRFVVRISAYPGGRPDQITEDDLDDDHMEELSEALRREDGTCSEALDGHGFKGFRFDLCPGCHKRFVSDPLGRELSRLVDLSNFSPN